MTGYIFDFENKVLENENFREVLYTSQHSQLVVMSLNPQEEIGMEIHEIVDQFIRVEQGVGKAIIDKEEYELSAGAAIIIPAGTEHNIINTSSDKKMKLYTVYSPPHHKKDAIHKTKQAAELDSADHI